MSQGSYDLVVVGAGISGLSLAYRYAQARPNARVLVVESASRAGGNLRTDRSAPGYIIDAGPDSWVSQKPQALALCKELGLAEQIMGTKPDTRAVYISHQGRLHSMPEGLVLGIPTAVRPMVTTPLFTWAGKMRMGLELFVPPRISSEDETVESFLTRRLGPELCERLAGPLLGGIFSGEPSELSMRTCFPMLLEAETKHGSLIRAMRARKASAPAGPAPSAFATLRGGVGTLIEALLEALRALGVEVRTASAVERLQPGDGHEQLRLADGTELRAKQVAFAGPAHVPAALLGPAWRDSFSMFRYASAATVFLAYDEHALGRPLDGVGFVVPKSEGRAITACTWVSSKWEGRAPDGKALVRLFFGGPGGQQWLQRSDAELEAAARAEFEHYVGAARAPEFARVYRFRKGTPGAPFNHLRRVADVRARLAAERARVHVLGNGYDGTGIPDCVRQASALAQQLAQKF